MATMSNNEKSLNSATESIRQHGNREILAKATKGPANWLIGEDIPPEQRSEINCTIEDFVKNASKALKEKKGELLAEAGKTDFEELAEAWNLDVAPSPESVVHLGEMSYWPLGGLVVLTDNGAVRGRISVAVGVGKAYGKAGYLIGWPLENRWNVILTDMANGRVEEAAVGSLVRAAVYQFSQG